MAKGKHSVALFEVISAGKTTSRASSLSTPKWWFKKSTPDAPVAAATALAVDESTAPAPRTPGVDLKVDPDKQHIKFTVSYSSAIVSGFTVIVVVGLAYIIGTRMSHGPTPAAAAAGSTELIKRGPVSRDVLDVAPVAPAVTPAPAPTVSNPPSQPQPQTPTPVANTVTPTVADPSARTIALNYVVVQSYPTEQMANDARDLLIQNGIAATVEKELKGWGTSASSRYSVVGLKGFARIKTNPEYDAYLKSINDVSSKFTKNPKFNKFDPHPYSWKDQGAR